MKKKLFLICFIIGAFFIAGFATASQKEVKEEAYLEAAKEIAEQIGTDTVLTREQLLEEL